MYNKMDHRINKFQHRFFEERLEGVGISGPVGGYLMVIFEKKTMKMNDLIEDLPFHKSHATRAINRLQELGYIIKTVDSEDA
ncbi:MAG: helix-turn-helix domain-containing protein, partial [Bacteroidales bacterium]